MADTEENNLMTTQNLILGAAVLGGVAYYMSGSGEDTRRIVKGPGQLSEYGKGPHWTTQRDAEMPIKMSEEGIASIQPETIVDVFQQAVQMNADNICWRREVNGEWETCTWVNHYRNCTQMAKALMAVGVNQHDAVNIVGFNSYQWITANLGCVLAGGISAGQYTTNNPGQCEYIANHCGAKVIFLESRKQLEKWVDIQMKLPNIVAFVIWNGDDVSDLVPRFQTAVYTYDDFVKLGDGVSDDDLANRQAKIRPGHCAELIYTSGTTGNPKAVMMSHDNLVWTTKSLFETFGIPDEFRLRTVSYLPLSHVAAQLVDMYGPLICTAENAGQAAEVWFARPDALKGTLKNTLVACKPTLFFGVPRVWEKFKAAILEKAKVPKGAVMQALVDWAKAKCFTRNDSLSESENFVQPFGYGIAKKLMGKVKAALGLDQCLIFLTGAAPINRDTLDYFKNLDIFIDEVYGMSESSGPASMGRLYHRQMGTTGPAMMGCEIKLEHVEGRDKEGEGEICFRGRNIMMGYLGMDQKTQESIDDDGFMHSGDVGRFDEYDCLAITGRIKELIITEGGENIAPVPIEHYIKSKLKAVSNVIMIGDRRKYCTCLVTLKTKVDVETELPTNQLDSEALDVSEGVTTVGEAQNDEAWKTYILDGITAYNNDPQACASRAQKIQYFKILNEDLSSPQGTLGPTLKVKRPVVYKMYQDVIDSMY